MLEKLNSNYSSRGLEILPFQCSQFLNQGPGTDLEFSNSLKFVRPGGGYEPAFGPIFSKVDVNGADAHPLWKKLRSSCPLTPGGILQPVGYPPIAWTPITTSDVQWNFEKILISRKGIPSLRFNPSAMDDDMRAEIERLLDE